jgi:hypothetical protein
VNPPARYGVYIYSTFGPDGLGRMSIYYRLKDRLRRRRIKHHLTPVQDNAHIAWAQSLLKRPLP